MRPWERVIVMVASVLLSAYIVWQALAFTVTLVQAVNAAHARLTVIEQRLKGGTP